MGGERERMDLLFKMLREEPLDLGDGDIATVVAADQALPFLCLDMRPPLMTDSLQITIEVGSHFHIHTLLLYVYCV